MLFDRSGFNYAPLSAAPKAAFGEDSLIMGTCNEN